MTEHSHVIKQNIEFKAVLLSKVTGSAVHSLEQHSQSIHVLEY